MKVYIAGPYTRPEPVENVRRAIAVADELLAAGHLPYLPHLTMLWNLVAPKPVAAWYDYDLRWLPACDCVLRIPGESTGADAEVAEAERLGIPIYHSVGEIPA